jgi:hypothetical protein
MYTLPREELNTLHLIHEEFAGHELLVVLGSHEAVLRT